MWPLLTRTKLSWQVPFWSNMWPYEQGEILQEPNELCEQCGSKDGDVGLFFLYFVKRINPNDFGGGLTFSSTATTRLTFVGLSEKSQQLWNECHAMEFCTQVQCPFQTCLFGMGRLLGLQYCCLQLSQGLHTQTTSHSTLFPWVLSNTPAMT